MNEVEKGVKEIEEWLEKGGDLENLCPHCIGEGGKTFLSELYQNEFRYLVRKCPIHGEIYPGP